MKRYNVIAKCENNKSIDCLDKLTELHCACDCLSALKHVTPDMQTHKNTTLRAGPAPFKAPVVSNTHRPVSAPKPVDKPPSLFKDGKKWIVVSVFAGP